MADHGLKDLTWQGRDTGVAVADSGVAVSSAGGVDILTVAGLTILPPSVSLALYTSRTDPNVNVYLQFSKDGTTWAPASTATKQGKALFVTHVNEDLATGSNESAIYTRSVQARYMRMLYESLSSSGGPTTMQFDWAAVFGETP